MGNCSEYLCATLCEGIIQKTVRYHYYTQLHPPKICEKDPVGNLPSLWTVAIVTLCYNHADG